MDAVEAYGGVLALYLVIALGVVFIVLFGDMLRRDDIGGGMKALWAVALFAFPLLGSIIYIVARPKKSSGGYDSFDEYPSANARNPIQ